MAPKQNKFQCLAPNTECTAAKETFSVKCFPYRKMMDKGLFHIIGTPGCHRGFLLPLREISKWFMLLSYLQFPLLGLPSYPACAHKVPSVLEGFWVKKVMRRTGKDSLAVGMGSVPHSPGPPIAQARVSCSWCHTEPHVLTGNKSGDQGFKQTMSGPEHHPVSTGSGSYSCWIRPVA